MNDTESALEQIKQVLEYRHSIEKLIDGYNGIEGFLGERFFETHFQMCKSPRGRQFVDGHIGDKSVQVKFKWVNAENLKTRYVEIDPNAEFDWLAIACAESGDSKVSLYGIWESEIVWRLLKSNRVQLKKLRRHAQVKKVCSILEQDPSLLYM